MTARWPRAAIPLVLLGLIIALGAWLRLYALDRLPPPALHPDEGYYGLDALEIMRGRWMVYSPVNTGREALFMTLAAGVFKLFGVSVLNFRAFTAVLGILTLPALFWLGFEASPHRAHARWLGLLAAASAATLLLHVVLNRDALRVNMQPLFTALTFAALLRAFRGQRRRWFILAGVLLGLSAHTYVTVRLLPLVVVAAFALWWPRARPARREHVIHFGLVAGLSMLVYAPLGLYFLRHPEMFLYRAQILFDPNALGQSTWATLLMFHVSGDHVLNNNLPLRPALDLAQALAFWIGALAALAGRHGRVGRLLLAWFVVGVFPSAFAKDAPSYIHAFGMVPPMAVLMGLGYLSAATWLEERLRRSGPAAALARPLGVGVLVLGLSYSAWRTYQDYFVRWAGQADLSLAYRTDLMRIDDYMRRLPPDTEVFFSPYYWIEPPLEFARAGDAARLHPFDGHHCLPLGDAARNPLAYFVGDPYSLAALREYFPEGRASAAPEFAVFQVPAGARARFNASNPGSAVWREQLALPHASVERLDGQSVRVHLVWQTRPPYAAVSFHRFVHLLSDDPVQPGGVRLWAQADDAPCRGSHPPHYWQAGEAIVESVTLTAADPLPPGDYRVALGLYAPGAPVRLAVAEATWPVKDDVVTLMEFSVSE